MHTNTKKKEYELTSEISLSHCFKTNNDVQVYHLYEKVVSIDIDLFIPKTSQDHEMDEGAITGFLDLK